MPKTTKADAIIIIMRYFSVALMLNAFFLKSIKKAAPAVAASQNMNSVNRSPARTAPSKPAAVISMIAKYRSEGRSLLPTLKTEYIMTTALSATMIIAIKMEMASIMKALANGFEPFKPKSSIGGEVVPYSL